MGSSNMNIPTLSGNWVDLIVILIVLFYLWESWGRGFLLSLVDLAGLLLAFLIAFKTYSLAGDYLITNFSLPRGIANAAGFILTGVILEVFFSFLINLFHRRIYYRFIEEAKKDRSKDMLLKLDKVFGVIPAVAEALLFSAVVLTLFITLPVQGKIKKDILDSKIGAPLVSRTEGIERQLNAVFGQAVSETLTFLTVNPNPLTTERVNLHFTQSEVKVDIFAEEEMLSLVNVERTKLGLDKLIMSPALRDLARDYAKDMFLRGYFSHYNKEEQSPFDRMDKAGISYAVAGENLALAPNVTLAHQGLMNSEGHRANILSSEFRKIGIGVIDGGIYGEMVVQEFTD